MDDMQEASLWMGYARLALSLVDLNGKPLPDCIEGKQINPEALEEKISILQDLADVVTEVLFVNLGWFRNRMNKALSNGEDFFGQ